MVNVLLLREDTYVIVVNWSNSFNSFIFSFLPLCNLTLTLTFHIYLESGPETSPRTYFQAAANTRVVGAEVSCFINQLVWTKYSQQQNIPK